MSFVTNVRFSASPDMSEEAYVAPTLAQRLQNYSEPFILYYLGLFTFLKVVLRTLLSNPSGLFQFSRVRSKAFAETWEILGSPNADVGPFKSAVPLFKSAGGVVLDLGPADGRQIVNYTSPKIKTMYGVEPCTEFHSGLKTAADKAGLGSKYHIVSCGAQPESLVPGLTEAGLLKGKAEGVFDTIIACKVLCSVPNCEAAIAGLYALLKPGGRMLVCEHIKNPWRTPKGNLLSRVIQELFMIQGWSFLLGGCHLNRATHQMLTNAANRDGGWKSMDLELVVQWGAIPFVIGELVKKD